MVETSVPLALAASTSTVAAALQSPSKPPVGLEKAADSSTNNKSVSSMAASDDPTARAIASLAAASSIVSSLHPALSAAAVTQLRLHALSHLAQAAAASQHAIAAVSSLRATFPALLSKHIRLLTSAAEEAVAVAAHLTADASTRALLLPPITSLLSSFHAVLSYLPSTHSICPATRAQLYRIHLLCMRDSPTNSALRPTYLLYIKHLPSAQRDVLRQLDVGAVEDKQAMEDVHAALLINTAYGTRDRHDAYKLLQRACDAVSDKHSNVCARMQMAQWLYVHTASRQDALDVLLAALDSIHDAEVDTADAQHHHGDTQRSHKSDNSQKHSSSATPSLAATSSTPFSSSHPHAAVGQSRRQSVSSGPPSQRQRGGNGAPNSGRRHSLVSTASGNSRSASSDTHSLGVRELCLLVRGYAMVAAMSDREDERLEWTLTAAHFAHRIWTTNIHTIQHHLTTLQQHHDKLVHERANKLLINPTAQLPTIPPLTLPPPPTLPTVPAQWLTLQFDPAVQQLMDSEALRAGCVNGWSLAQPLVLYASVQSVVERLAGHGWHVQCVPLVALQLRLAELHIPQLRLLPLTRLRAALLCDQLGMEAECQQLLSGAEGEWMPTRAEVEEGEKLRHDKRRERELTKLKEQRANQKREEEHKQQLSLLSPSASQPMSPTSSSAAAVAASSSSAFATSFPSASSVVGFASLSVVDVWVQSAELLLLLGRYAPARVLLALASAHAELLGAHDLRLVSPLVSATSLFYQGHLSASLRLSAAIAASETRSEQWRHSVRLLLDAVRLSTSGAPSSESVLKRQAGAVDKLLAVCGARLQQTDVAGLHAFAHECTAFLYGVQAQTMVEQASRSLLPALPLSASLLAASNVLRDPALLLPSSFLLPSYCFLQQCYLRAFSLFDRGLLQCEQLGDARQIAELTLCRAHACWLYAKLWSDRSILPRLEGAAFGEDERKSLAHRHLHEALRWFQRAEEAVKQQCNRITTSAFGQPPSSSSSTPSLSLPIHRRLARIQSDIALLYCDLYHATFPPPLFAPPPPNPNNLQGPPSPSLVNGGNEAERLLMEVWMDKYADVFTASPPPPPPSLPLAAITSANAALQLDDSARAHFVAGHAYMTRMEEESESDRQQRKKAEKGERRRKEKEEWKKRVYTKPETPEQRAARERAEQQQRESNEQQLMAQQEQMREAELQKQREEEERKKREEDEAAALKSSRGKKGAKAAPTLMSPSKKAEAERLEAERRDKEEKRREEERLEKEKQEKEALAAEEASFAYDESEWSPVYLLRWKREVEREKLESRMEQMEEQTKAASSGKGGKEAKNKDERKREKIRQPSTTSISMSDEDDGLDPTILMDEPFDDDTLAHSAYSHLFSSLSAALESHNFELLASASLSLVHLFTTRHPLLSSKYLSLYLSAVVNKYVIDLATSLQPASEEMIIYGEKQRLKGRQSNSRHGSGSRGGGWCWQTGMDLLDEYLDDRSLLSQWTTIPTPYEDEKEEVVLRGWDSTYAQMLVSIPSSVSIVTLLYTPDEHAVYVSLLSSVGFPLSSRFSRTVLSEVEEDQLHSLIRYFRSFSSTLATPLASASSPASATRLDELDSSFMANVALLTSLFTLPFSRALLSSELLDDRDVILLACPLLFCLPWESVPLLHGHRSLCRDFSFAFFSRRMEQSSADNVSRDNVGYVLDARAADSQRSMERAMSPLIDAYGKGWKSRKGRDGPLHHWEWKGLLEEGQDGGAFFHVGYEPLLSAAQASALNAVDCTGVRLAVLMDHAVKERGGVGASGGVGEAVQAVKDGGVDGGGCVYDTSVLLSVRGVNTILTHAWSVSEVVNASHTFLLANALSNGQSVASAVKLLTTMTQCEPLPQQRPPTTATDPKPTPPSPSAKKQRGAGTPKAASTPKRGMTPKGGRTPRVGMEDGSGAAGGGGGGGLESEVAVRVFDRYNTVLLGLPHWRM